MKIYFNSPVVLTFSAISFLLVLLQHFGMSHYTNTFFTVPGNALAFDFYNPIAYFRLVSHSMGHANWDHLIANLTLILLLGPMLEEKYGSQSLLIMMLITALTTGLLNMMLFPTGLLGASGIAFTFILLSSFANMRSGGIPLSFLIVACFFLGKEVLHATQNNQISEFAHLCGGILGAVFGFIKK